MFSSQEIVSAPSTMCLATSTDNNPISCLSCFIGEGGLTSPCTEECVEISHRSSLKRSIYLGTGTLGGHIGSGCMSHAYHHSTKHSQSPCCQPYKLCVPWFFKCHCIMKRKSLFTDPNKSKNWRLTQWSDVPVSLFSALCMFW